MKTTSSPSAAKSRWLTILAILLVPQIFPAAGVAAQSPKRLAAYYCFGIHRNAPKYTAAQIPYTNLTHLMHVAVEPTAAADGSIEILQRRFEPDVVSRAHRAGVKVLVCVQGPAAVFSKIAAHPEARTWFGAALHGFITQYGYDGADIDWEVPLGKTDAANCTALMRALRAALPAPCYLLSMATPSVPGGWGEFDFTGLTPLVDFYNVMTYDYPGPWTKHAGHNSPLFANGADPRQEGSLDESVNLYLNKLAVPPEKINLGTAFYGYEFAATNLFAPAQAEIKTVDRTYGSYIKQRINREGWTRHIDSIAMAPYLLHEAEPVRFLTYDDAESTARKVVYALQVRNLGGVFMWELAGDFDGKNQELLQAMRKAFVTTTAKGQNIPDITLHVNQVGYDARGPKFAVVSTGAALNSKTRFHIVNMNSGAVEFSGKLEGPQEVQELFPGKKFYKAAFSAFINSGTYALQVEGKDRMVISKPFQIEDTALAKLTIPSIIQYYNQQRANTPEEWEADKAAILYGSTNTLNIRGGWADASGDISKDSSHLAYANLMFPEQIPLVTWSLTGAAEANPRLLGSLGVTEAIGSEALWRADYILRALPPDNYFYMTVFTYFNPDPNARRVVGLEANSVTTSDYQCAVREGGGMAIAALARISQWNKHGASSSEQYLAGAKRSFAHLLVNNLKYCDDHKETIIDDYCALMAATELWLANDSLHLKEARQRASNLAGRMSPRGYFLANDANRPFWHAADAGLPVIALARYLKIETDPKRRAQTLAVIKQPRDYNLRITSDTSNPFGYARQNFLFQGRVKEGFFIPHENETGWWWQGENARLGSLAAAALVGGRLVYPASNGWGVEEPLGAFASQQVSWILGCDPYSMCFMYGLGKNHVPYMHASFGHGSGKGGISNGITGNEGYGDGSGIDYKDKDNGNEWRWTEQWIPHAAWFLQAISAMAEPPSKSEQQDKVPA